MRLGRSKRLIAILSSTTISLLACARLAQAQSDVLLINRPEDSRIVGRDGKDQAGSALAVGDISGDGIADIIVGTPDSDGVGNSRPSSGEVAVVLGGPDLPLNFPLANAAHTFYGATDAANLGAAVAVGDVNADGMGDLIMGATKADARRQGGAGAVYVVYGGTKLTGSGSVDLASVHADIILYGTESGGRLGAEVVVGDFNGDGRQDVAFAGPREGAQFNRLNAGVVYIFFGGPGYASGLEVEATVHPELAAQTEMTILGPAVDGLAGRALAAGDVNGDGVDDLLIGTTLSSAFGRIGSGDVYVVFGRAGLVPGASIDLAVAAQVDLKIQGPLSGDDFGLALGTADINGDDTRDLLIGAPQSPFVPGVPTGRAYAIFGRPFVRGTTIDLSTQPADVTLAGPHDGAALGTSVSGGDMNGDGIDEWVVGAPGADGFGEAYRMGGRVAWSELGVVGALTQGAQKGDGAGTVTVVGDVSGDGLADLVLSSPLFEVNADQKRDQGAVYVIRGRPGPYLLGPDCVDEDGDGFRAGGRTCGPADCDDHDPATHPFATEICNDGIDNDCDGFTDLAGIDEDGDGWPGGPSTNGCLVLDCNDHDPTIHPGIPEVCADGVDNNCDGLADANDPECAGINEICGNCVDDDANGDGDLAEPSCAGGMSDILQIKQVTARRAKKTPTIAKQLVVKGVVFDAPALAHPSNDVLAHGLIVGLTLKDGGQLCIAVDKVKRKRGGTLVFSSSTQPRARLQVLAKPSGRIKFAVQYKAAVPLPASPMTLSLGVFAPAAPYRGAVEVKVKGRTGSLVVTKAIP